MKYKLVLRNNKFLVVSLKYFKVYGVVGRIVGASHTTRVKQVEINVDLLSLWLQRGIFISSTVGRMLSGIENVIYEEYK